nr:N-acetyltransferase [Escherichia coli]
MLKGTFTPKTIPYATETRNYQDNRTAAHACIDGTVVGHLTIDVQQRPRRSHVADFGICVDSRWKNRGVASALMREMIEMCDNWLRVDRIELTVFVDNAPAIKVYKKYGFEIEGTGKKYALRNGEYVDAYYMARVK